MTTVLSALVLGSHLILGGSDCQVTRVYEDGFANADCADGSHWAFDADGQPYENAAGVPVREPGWYRVVD